MIKKLAAQAAGAATVLAGAASAATPGPNKVAGVWHPVSVVMEANSRTLTPFGPNPHGKLIFAPDFHYVELLNDPRVQPFKSANPSEGTDSENRAAMAGSLALYGRYTVDERGEFAGNTVEGSSFPNWIGNIRTTKELTLAVQGDRMTEAFHQPAGAKVTIVWERVPD